MRRTGVKNAHARCDLKPLLIDSLHLELNACYGKPSRDNRDYESQPAKLAGARALPMFLFGPGVVNGPRRENLGATGTPLD